MYPQTTPLVLGPVGSQGFNTGLPAHLQAWIVTGAFLAGILALIFWGFIGGSLDVNARGGVGA